MFEFKLVRDSRTQIHFLKNKNKALGIFYVESNSFFCSQVNEIYHDQSLGARINVVLVRIVLVDAKKVSMHFISNLKTLFPFTEMKKNDTSQRSLYSFSTFTVLYRESLTYCICC